MLCSVLLVLPSCSSKKKKNKKQNLKQNSKLDFKKCNLVPAFWLRASESLEQGSRSHTGTGIHLSPPPKARVSRGRGCSQHWQFLWTCCSLAVKEHTPGLTRHLSLEDGTLCMQRGSQTCSPARENPSFKATLNPGCASESRFSSHWVTPDQTNQDVSWHQEARAALQRLRGYVTTYLLPV